MVKWPCAARWKWRTNSMLRVAPPSAPKTGNAEAAARSETTIPNRGAIDPTNALTAGADAAAAPRSTVTIEAAEMSREPQHGDAVYARLEFQQVLAVAHDPRGLGLELEQSAIARREPAAVRSRMQSPSLMSQVMTAPAIGLPCRIEAEIATTSRKSI
jgi:hypothetical protein